MTGVDIHASSPISSESSREDTVMAEDKPVVKDFAAYTPTETMSFKKDIVYEGSWPDHSSAMEIETEAGHESSRQDALMEEILTAVEPVKQASAIEATQPAHTTVATDWHAYYSTVNKARRSIPKAHNRNTSVSATMDLPWAVDNTSSSPQASHKRNTSSSIPPPPKAAEMNPNSIGIAISTGPNDERYGDPFSTKESPKLHPLTTKVPPTSPTPYTHSSARQAPSPYSSTSSSSQSQLHSHSHTHSLTNPPGYTQNTHASFSTIQTNNTSTTATTLSHPPTPITTSISFSRPSSSHSTDYSPTDKSAPPIPLYNTNTSPFYTNSYTGANYDYDSGYNNTLFSPTFSFAAPSTPKTPASASRRGILDNDPSIYLRPEEDDDSTIWDTASKWAKIASKKLSLNGGGAGEGGNDRHSSSGSSARGGVFGPASTQAEFSISSGLWRMVGGSAEERSGMYQY